MTNRVQALPCDVVKFTLTLSRKYKHDCQSPTSLLSLSTTSRLPVQLQYSKFSTISAQHMKLRCSIICSRVYTLTHLKMNKNIISGRLLFTVKILNIGTDRSEQTVQTQIRLLLMEQSDQGLLCLLFCLHLLNTILHCKIQLFQL